MVLAATRSGMFGRTGRGLLSAPSRGEFIPHPACVSRPAAVPVAGPSEQPVRETRRDTREHANGHPVSVTEMGDCPLFLRTVTRYQSRKWVTVPYFWRHCGDNAQKVSSDYKVVQ